MKQLRATISLGLSLGLILPPPAIAQVVKSVSAPAAARGLVPVGAPGVQAAPAVLTAPSQLPSLAATVPTLTAPNPARAAAAPALAIPQAAVAAVAGTPLVPAAIVPAAPVLLRAAAVVKRVLPAPRAAAKGPARTALQGLRLDLPSSSGMGLTAASGQEARNFAARMGDEPARPSGDPVPLQAAASQRPTLQAAVAAPAPAPAALDPLFSQPRDEKFKNFKYLLDADGVAAVAFSRTPINALSLEVIDELHVVADTLAADPAVKSVLLTGEGAAFLAGADINLLYSVRTVTHGIRLSRNLQVALDKFENMDKPVVMALNGFTVGGGLETAMAGHVRIASDKVEFKLPEVELGILPAGGAPQRLPRLIGLTPALKLLLSGEFFGAAEALRLGLVDRVVAPDQLMAEARKEAKRLAELPPAEKAEFLRTRRTLQKPIPLTWREWFGLFFDGFFLRRWVFSESSRAGEKDYEEIIMKIIDATLIGAIQGPEAGLGAEADFFGELASSPTSKILTQLALRRHGGPRVKRYGEKGGKPLPVERVAVVGGGVMGSAIAGLAAFSGLPATIKDVDGRYLEAGLAKARELVSELGRREKTEGEALAKKQALVAGTIDDSVLAASKPSLVIEAIREDEADKTALFARLGRELPPETIFASNTSVLSINTLARASGRPERFVGLHYFNPVDKLALVELIVPDTQGFTPEQLKTMDQTIGTALAFLKKTGRVVVVVKDAPGFAVNRVLLTYLNEANKLVEEGAGVEQVDAVMRAFGLPMGPFELTDFVGLGLATEVGGHLQASLPHFGPLSGLLVRLRAMAGATYHLYKEVLHRKSGRVRKVRQVANEAVVRQAAGAASHQFSDLEIQRRLLLVMANEALRLVSEGVVESPQEADLALAAGMGFPVSTGGLLRYIESLGLTDVIARLRSYEAATGRAVFTPAPALLAAEGKGLYPEVKP
ncbi:MAG: enoyl-CoA hydratase/isomerase family protein [Elusimicrobia bacterium]|nr:enoyl-CoA hydratase/isomerase family protein [Elusimicrobiota bacterium]